MIFINQLICNNVGDGLFAQLSPTQDLLQTSQRCHQDHISVTNIQQGSPTFSQIQVTVLVTVMVTDSVCWSQSHLVGDFFNVKNRLPKSQIAHQHGKLVINANGFIHLSPTRKK